MKEIPKIDIDESKWNKIKTTKRSKKKNDC
jgi:hypothetical protein